MMRLLLVLVISMGPILASCGNRCQDGFLLVNGVCVNPDGGSGDCRAAPPGLYQGMAYPGTTKENGQPISFQLSEDRSQVTNFSIKTQLRSSGGGLPVPHEIFVESGFPLIGCGFHGVVLGGDLSGSFFPDNSSFVGLWFDTIESDGGFFSGSGTWEAFSAEAGADGGSADGGVVDAGVADGGAVDGGVADGGIVVDGGAPDGGVPADGGAVTDGGATTPITVPAGFTALERASGLAGPIALALDPGSGDVFVAQTFAGTVQRLPAVGSPETVLQGLVQPRGVSLVAGTPPRLYAAHEGGLTVTEIGGTPASFGPALGFPAGPLVCDDTPRCFVTELRFGERRRAVWRVTSTDATEVAGVSAGIDQPFGIVLAGPDILVAEANLGFASADSVLFHAIPLDGAAVTGFTPVPLAAQPGALALLGGSRFFVSEVVLGGGDDRAVYLLDRSGPASQPFARGFSLPTGLAFDGARQILYVSDLGRGKLYAIHGSFGSL